MIKSSLTGDTVQKDDKPGNDWPAVRTPQTVVPHFITSLAAVDRCLRSQKL